MIRYTKIIIYALFCIGLSCKNKSQENNKNKVLVESAYETETTELIDDTLSTVVIPNISGRYDLVEGYATGVEKRHSYKIFKGILKIEQVSENEFGYVRVIKRHQISPNGDYGIFSFQENRFYDKNIDYSKKALYYSEFTRLLFKPNLLCTIRYFSEITEYCIWEKVDTDKDIYISLRKRLEKEKKNLKDYYDLVYNDPEVTRRDEFVKVGVRTEYDINDEVFMEYWSQFEIE